MILADTRDRGAAPESRYVLTEAISDGRWHARLTDWQWGAPIGCGVTREHAIADLRRQLLAEDAEPPLTFWPALGLLLGGAICVPLIILGIYFALEVLL